MAQPALHPDFDRLLKGQLLMRLWELQIAAQQRISARLYPAEGAGLQMTAAAVQESTAPARIRLSERWAKPCREMWGTMTITSRTPAGGTKLGHVC